MNPKSGYLSKISRHLERYNKKYGMDPEFVWVLGVEEVETTPEIEELWRGYRINSDLILYLP